MSSKASRAQAAIDESAILQMLQPYAPEVVSTIFVGLDTSESDIDIVCTYRNQAAFIEAFRSAYSGFDSYSLMSCDEYALGRFRFNQFLIEVYASTTPVRQQLAYRHYQVMKRLVEAGGEAFIDQVRQLKESGMKTEPAICCVLGLSGDPYSAVLELEQLDSLHLLVDHTRRK